ncbi:MAG: helix-hairpin-helix domain-containing protein [Pontimonas sp.]
MGVARTLWDLLDYRRVSEDIVDTRDPGTGNHFAGPRPLRWKVGMSAALVLGAGVLVIVVGSEFLRSLPTGPEPLPMPSVPTEASAQTPELMVLVHVVGAVEEPGVVSLPENSRVHDALALAGGAQEDAELGGVNLARIVYDGEQIIVPRVGEPAVASSGAGSGPISLSRADQETLETLPRIGPATAERIIAWRDKNGPFRSVEDLLAVSGIGPATLEGLAEYVVP